jgi:hypothetical protein
MKSFKEWQIKEVNYNQNIDGPPLEPATISGAQVQIRQLAFNIRTTFVLDEKFIQYKRTS